MKKHLLKSKFFWLAIAVALVPAVVFGINTINEGFKVDSETAREIDATSVGGPCKYVTNDSVTNDYFVPTKTATEWNSFIANPPTGVVITGCIGSVITYSGPTDDIPRAIAYDGTNMWVANNDATNSITKISSSGAMTGYTLNGWGNNRYPTDIAFDGTNLWTANENSDTVTKVATNGSLVAEYNIGLEPFAITYGGGYMWTANTFDESVFRVTLTGTPMLIDLAGYKPNALAHDGTYLWVATSNSPAIVKISNLGSVLATYPLVTAPTDIVNAGSYLWMTYGSGHGHVTRMTKSTGTTTNFTIILNDYWANALAYDNTDIWTTAQSFAAGHGLIRVTSTGTATEYIDPAFSSSPVDIAFDNSTSMWTVNTDGSVSKMVVKYPGGGGAGLE
ncbi:TPA: hypothetical protein DCZ15_02345 [Candidatus Falkowbacteria bacterium]|nr:MAG: hypothetical protein UV95_C0001G0138 [Candidatus Falkowbacteria bacterium GW2011_GWF2_43_32]HBA36694.1 hypothetical protein [Candidatus Falkowbacteria bacterium]